MMMKPALFGAVVLLCASPAHAQPQHKAGDPSYNYDFEAPLYTVVDRATKAYFTGWSGDCNSGRLPLAFTLYRIDNGHLVNVPVTLNVGPRPDAAAYLAAVCNRPFDTNVGWSLVPANPEPEGQFEYVVLVTDVPTAWTCKAMPPGFPNSGQMVCDFWSNAVYRIIN